jgi:hypothetical protein
MLAKEVLREARYKLSDTSVSRWTDARLLVLLNEAIVDVSKNTILFIEELYYPIPTLVGNIDLTSKALKIIRAEYLDDPLPFFSFDEADYKFGSLWQQEKGSRVKGLIYGRQRNMVLKQYPLLDTSYNPHIIYNSVYGITTDISYSDINPVLTDVYGDIAHIPDDAVIKFYYIRKHEKITDINTTLLIDELIKPMLVHYIVGHAFKDNQDTQNMAKGTEELQQYYSKVEEYSIQKSQLYVRSTHETRYDPAGLFS